MLTETLSTQHLDYLQRSGFQPRPLPGRTHLTRAPGGPPDGLHRMLRVAGIGRLQREQPTPASQSVRIPTEDAFSGLYGYGISLAMLVKGGPAGMSLQLGVWSPAESEHADGRVLDARLGILASVLEALYPAVYIAQPGNDAPIEPLGGLALGIPSIKPPDPTDPALPLDRLIRALAGLTWSILVLAEPVRENRIDDLRNSVVNEMRAAESAPQAMQAPSPLAEHYTDLLKVSLHSLTHAQAVGGWRTAAYLCGDPTSYYRLATVWRSEFSGDQSLPEPMRVWDMADAPRLAHDWAMPDTPADPGPGVYRHPFSYQTLLTSSQLAAYIHLPQQETNGYYVRLVPDFHSVPPPPAAVSIPLGTIVHRDHDTKVQYTINPRTLTQHTLVAGITGSGKTNTIFHLLRACQPRVPFLVLEPAKAEYRTLLDAPELKGRLLVFTLGDERGSPFRMNPFEVVGWPKTSVAVHLDLLRAAFSTGFGMWTPLPQVLERCLHAIYRDRGWNTATNDNSRLKESPDVSQAWPTLSDLAAKIEEVVRQLGYEERVTSDFRAALLTRVNGLRTGGKGRMLDVQRSLPMDLLLGQPAVLELEGIGSDDDKALLMALLLIRIIEQRRADSQAGDLRHLLVIEEAHRLLANPGPRLGEEQADPRGQAVETFTNLLAEIRAYGQGVVVADQVPTKLASEVLKNTGLKIVHQVVATDDRAALAGTMDMSERQAEAVSVLDRGVAAVFGIGDDAPVLVSIGRVKGGPGETTPDLQRVAGEMQKAPALLPHRALFEPLGGLLHLSGPEAHEACDAARALSEDPAVRADFARLVLSVLEDDTALNRLWPQIVAHARSVHKRGGVLSTLLRCLVIYLSAWLAQRRGAQAHWTFAETAEYDTALGTAILARLDGQDTGPLLQKFRETTTRLHALEVLPFLWCDQICGHKPGISLYRHAVADVIGRGERTATWEEARARDGGLAGPQLWEVCKGVAQQLVEWTPSQQAATCSIGLCFAQQMLARNPGLLPEVRQAAMERLLSLAFTPSDTKAAEFGKPPSSASDQVRR